MNVRIDPATTLVTVLAACSLGCLSKDVTHALTLEDDGSVTWTVLEADVRSVEKDAEERAKDEANYLEQALSDELPAALAMDSAGAHDVRTTVLRDRPPFRVQIESRFSSIDEAVAAWTRAGMSGEWLIERQGEATTLTLSLPAGVSPSASLEDDTPWKAMVGEAARLKIVPASGAFHDPVGFTADDDGMRAAWQRRPGCPTEAEAPTTWSLKWTPELPDRK